VYGIIFSLLVLVVLILLRCGTFGSIVEFATYGDMKNAITKLDDTEINGRRIRIVEQKSRGRRQRYMIVLTVCILCVLYSCIW